MNNHNHNSNNNSNNNYNIEATASKHFELSNVNRTPADSMPMPHTHSHHELFYLMSGECDLTIKQTVYTLTPRMGIFIPANTPHKTTYKDAHRNERLNIEFSNNYLSDIINDFGQTWIDEYIFKGPLSFSPIAAPAISAAITRLEVDCADTTRNNYEFRTPDKKQHTSLMGMSTNTETGIINRYGSIPNDANGHDLFADLMRKLHFQELIITMLRRHSENDYVTTDQMQIADLCVRQAKKHIDENYTEPLSLDDLANHYQLNPTYFSNKFKSINGIGFKEYLNNVRIVHAERLLLETTMSITEIALECGYESSNYFGDVFRKVNKVSPSQFRKAKGIV